MRREGFEWLSRPVAEVDGHSRARARARQGRLTKPPGSLGRLEALAEAFAGWQGTDTPSLAHCRVRVFAGDHGIAATGVSAFPQAVTAEMIANFARGGAAISVLSRLWGADFAVVNLGTVTPLALDVGAHPQVVDVQLAPGTADISTAPAMDHDLLAAALAVGAAEVTGGAVSPQLFIGGEMGIGNTAVTAALVSALLALAPEETVGPGTGLAGHDLHRKRRAVARALALHNADGLSPLEALRRLGGLEIAALTGAYIAAAQVGTPSLVDGYICTAAALVACRINPGVRDWLLFAHHSTEPGHQHLLAALQATPLLDLGMHLGEGSGAAVALPLLKSACALHNGMATFDEAGVSGGESG